MACRGFKNIAERVRALRMYSNPICSFGAGINHTVVYMDEGIYLQFYTLGFGAARLGHGGSGEEENEPVPRMVHALAEKKMVGALAGN